MGCKHEFDDSERLAADCASRAVGVPESNKKWFVAMVATNTEKAANKRLGDLGYETYLPVQEYVSTWKDGRKKKMERIVIPAIIFIHCTEAERKEVVNLSYISRFMVNRAAQADRFNRHPVAIVPDEQIETLRFMLGQKDGEVMFDNARFKAGDTIRIIRGSLTGLQGQFLQHGDGKSYVVVNLDCLGCARVEISPMDIDLVHSA